MSFREMQHYPARFIRSAFRLSSSIFYPHTVAEMARQEPLTDLMFLSRDVFSTPPKVWNTMIL